MAMDRLSNDLAALMTFCKDDEVRQLVREKPKVAALVYAVRNFESMTEAAAYDIVQQRSAAMEAAIRDEITRQYECLRAFDMEKYKVLAANYLDIVNLEKWYLYRLGENRHAIETLVSQIKKQNHMITLRDTIMDWQSDTIRAQKNLLEDWATWGTERGWRPQDFGYHLLPREPVWPKLEARPAIPTATKCPERAVTNENNPTGADTEDIKEGLTDLSLKDEESVASNEKSSLAKRSDMEASDNDFKGVFEYAKRRNKVSNRSSASTSSSSNSDSVPSLTSDSTGTSLSEFTSVTERDYDGNDDDSNDEAAGWVWHEFNDTSVHEGQDEL